MARTYTCGKGCGDSFYSETARDAHEETCNGGQESDDDSDD